MSDAWSVVVEREPEWDDYARGEALALVVNEQQTCKSCGMRDSYVRVEGHTVTWGEHGGRKYHVDVLRCLGCGALDGVRRQFDRDHAEEVKNLEPGKASPLDGIRLLVDPVSEEE